MTTSVTVLDGGMGRELERIGAPFRQPEWSALALMESPEMVLQAHRNFVDAGAEVITTNAYAVVPFHIGADRHATIGADLAASAARLARQVADEYDRPIRVAGSIPPMFGSYQPEQFEPDRAEELYRVPVIAQAPFVDLWLGETMSCTAEADAVVLAVASHGAGRELWLSFTLSDELVDGRARLRSGESIGEAAAVAAPHATAVLFNCSAPEVMGAALRELRDALAALGATHVRTGAYANTFVPRPASYAPNDTILDLRSDLTPELYASFVHDWIALGATIVGGCCGAGPDHIAAITRDFEVIPPQA